MSENDTNNPVGRVPPRGNPVVGRVPPPGVGVASPPVRPAAATNAGLGNPAYTAGNSSEPPPRRLRRLHRVWPDRDGNISYLLTLCVENRVHALANTETFNRFTAFLLDSPNRYGWFPRRLVVMPDHIHLIARQGHDAVRLGQWMKALKAVVGGLERRTERPVADVNTSIRPAGSPDAASGDAAYREGRDVVGRVPTPGVSEHEFTRIKRSWRWQDGFHDHKFRNAAAEQRKWEYICLNPVRAGLVSRPEDWPFGGEIFYDPTGGPTLAAGTPPLLKVGILIEEGETPVGRVPSHGATKPPVEGNRPTHPAADGILRNLMGVAMVLLLSTCGLLAEVGIGESVLFTVDSRWIGFEGSAISSYFTVDTRFSGSSGEAYSGLFSVDTLGATTGTATIVGQVKDTLGTGLAGTTVSALINNVVRAQVGTDGSGHFTLSALPASSYTVRAEKVNYLSGVRYGLALANGQSASQNFTLTVLPGAPTVVNTNLSPVLPAALTNSQLMRWVGGAWITVSNSSELDLGKQTVIITHGWNSSATNAWPTNLATKMIAGGVTDANVLAWNWSKNAKTGLLLSLAFSRTPGEGRKLAQTLSNVLGNNYTNGIHFIGHSLGTLVNAAAADYLHNKTSGTFDWHRTQMTLLDNAELSNVEGQIRAVGYRVPGFESLLGWGDPPPLGWVSPLPEQRAWADNYMSLVGLYHFSVVNVDLRNQAMQQALLAHPLNPYARMVAAHGYARDWYAETAGNPALSILGNVYSFERLGENPQFPSPSPYAAGSLFTPLPLTEYNLFNVGDTAAYLAESGAEFVKSKVQEGVSSLVATGQKVGDVTVTVVESGISVLEDAAQTVVSLPIISLQAVLRSSGGSQLRMNNLVSGAGRLQNIGNYTNSPTAVWLPIQVPTNAALLSFDFTFTGNGGEDILSASIDGTNVFALDAQDMPTGQLLNSGPIDVTQWAGQDVELFFGLLGGTSVNAELSIAGMRFYQIDPPLLTAELSQGIIVVSWPATAAAYSLQSATNLTTSPWAAVANTPTLSGMRQYVTNAVSGQGKFYRLKRE